MADTFESITAPFRPKTQGGTFDPNQEAPRFSSFKLGDTTLAQQRAGQSSRDVIGIEPSGREFTIGRIGGGSGIQQNVRTGGLGGGQFTGGGTDPLETLKQTATNLGVGLASQGQRPSTIAPPAKLESGVPGFVRPIQSSSSEIIEVQRKARENALSPSFLDSNRFNQIESTRPENIAIGRLNPKFEQQERDFQSPLTNLEAERKKSINEFLKGGGVAHTVRGGGGPGGRDITGTFEVSANGAVAKAQQELAQAESSPGIKPSGFMEKLRENLRNVVEEQFARSAQGIQIDADIKSAKQDLEQRRPGFLSNQQNQFDQLTRDIGLSQTPTQTQSLFDQLNQQEFNIRSEEAEAFRAEQERNLRQKIQVASNNRELESRARAEKDRKIRDINSRASELTDRALKDAAALGRFETDAKGNDTPETIALKNKLRSDISNAAQKSITSVEDTFQNQLTQGIISQQDQLSGLDSQLADFEQGIRQSRIDRQNKFQELTQKETFQLGREERVEDRGIRAEQREQFREDEQSIRSLAQQVSSIENIDQDTVNDILNSESLEDAIIAASPFAPELKKVSDSSVRKFREASRTGFEGDFVDFLRLEQGIKKTPSKTSVTGKSIPGDISVKGISPFGKVITDQGVFDLQSDGTVFVPDPQQLKSASDKSKFRAVQSGEDLINQVEELYFSVKDRNQQRGNAVIDRLGSIGLFIEGFVGTDEDIKIYKDFLRSNKAPIAKGIKGEAGNLAAGEQADALASLPELKNSVKEATSKFTTIRRQLKSQREGFGNFVNISQLSPSGFIDQQGNIVSQNPFPGSGKQVKSGGVNQLNEHQFNSFVEFFGREPGDLEEIQEFITATQ